MRSMEMEYLLLSANNLWIDSLHPAYAGIKSEGLNPVILGLLLFS